MPNRRRSSTFIPPPSSLIPLLLPFLLALLLTLTLFTVWVDAKEKPKPQEWQIRGIEASLEDDRPGVKKEALDKLAGYDSQALTSLVKRDTVQKIGTLLQDKQQDSSVRGSAAAALGNFGTAAKDYIPAILDFIKDQQQAPYVRGSAAAALSNFGTAAKDYIPAIAAILKDQQQDSSVRGSAAAALSNFGTAAKDYIPAILDFIKDQQQAPYVRGRAAAALSNFGTAAKDYIPAILDLLKDQQQDSSVRGGAAAALSNFGTAAKDYIPAMLDFIKDQQQDFSVRGRAAEALSNFGTAAKDYIPAIADLLKDQQQDSYVRGSAAAALGDVEKLNLNHILVVLNSTYDEPKPRSISQVGVDTWRFYAYLLSGGDEQIKRLLKWVAKPKQSPEKLDHDEAVKTLEVFRDAWEPSKDLPELRDDLEKKIAIVARKVTWQMGDIALLQQHYANLKAVGSSNADSVQAAIASLTVWQWISNTWTAILTHAAFWLALVFAYPKFPQIQAIFFWNPWVRNVLGLGYVSFLLTWVPFLRRKLFEPFKPSLLADAGLNYFDPTAYFPESEVSIPGANQTQPITDTLPAIKGQLVLEGDSGLGKSMFLRHLVQRSQRIVVFLPAQKCDKGVIEAIQAKLHGDEIKDPKFLQNLIYSGAIDICIDGLNEVTADTRAKITQFVESYFKGNIIMTTQPLEWTPPSTAKTYVLQPLKREHIEHFLQSRQFRLPKDSKRQGTEYEQACTQYLNSALDSQQPSEELAATQRVLSNPMDLTIVAQMLAQGKPPDLFYLQEQQYKLMTDEYQQMWKQDFPLKKFAETVYSLRLNDEKALPASDFEKELLCMEDEKYKMVVSRQWQDADGKAKKEWYFRHDKIAEFFIVQTFLGKTEAAENRWIDHMGDPRFRGVYFLLATLLDTEDAQHLREMLIQYAADTKDHTVSDTVVQLLRSRKTF